MSAKTLIVAAVSFVAGAVVTSSILRLFAIAHHPELALVVGAILGSYVGVIMYHRQPHSTPSAKAKAQLGGVLAVACFVFSIVAQVIARLFQYPEVSIPIGMVGSFVFPLALFNQVWNAMEKVKKTGGKK